MNTLDNIIDDGCKRRDAAQFHAGVWQAMKCRAPYLPASPARRSGVSPNAIAHTSEAEFACDLRTLSERLERRFDDTCTTCSKTTSTGEGFIVNINQSLKNGRARGNAIEQRTHSGVRIPVGNRNDFRGSFFIRHRKRDALRTRRHIPSGDDARLPRFRSGFEYAVHRGITGISTPRMNVTTAGSEQV